VFNAGWTGLNANPINPKDSFLRGFSKMPYNILNSRRNFQNGSFVAFYFAREFWLVTLDIKHSLIGFYGGYIA
jgi:hypothetical protein